MNTGALQEKAESKYTLDEREAEGTLANGAPWNSLRFLTFQNPGGAYTLPTKDKKQPPSSGE